MSHHVYNTCGIVLGSRPVREADRIFLIFTEELGLVSAVAQGVRKESSKLRGFLVDGASVEVSLVRGKNGWRITTAALIRNNASLLEQRKDLKVSFFQIVLLLSKLIRGEEKHPEILAVFDAGIGYLLQESVSESAATSWEMIMAARILSLLGYFSSEKTSASLLEDEFSEALLQSAEKEKRVIVDAINAGIRASGLV